MSVSGSWSWLVAARRAALCALLGACNVTPATTTGGVDLPSRGDCARGIAVVSSDFQSSEVAILAPSGAVKSAAFLSSATTAASGLAAPFSGDIGVAPSHSRPGELVVVDRFGTNVLTFVDTRTTVVRAQLPVGTGFEANPQDYLEFGEHLAFVPRLGENASPGREPFDSGSDLLLVDPSVPSIVGFVPMPRKAGFLPNPAAVMRLGDDVLVTLVHASADFSNMADSELVAVASADQSVRYRLPLSGLKNCGRAELSPSGALLAIACSAFLDRKGAVADPSASALVLLDPSQDPPQELRRFAAPDLVQGPIQGRVEFVNDEVVLIKTQTALGAAQENRLFSVDLANGATTLLASAAPAQDGRGFGIALGGMYCDARCGDPCLVADASRGKLWRFRVQKDLLAPDDDVVIHGAGLPPTTLTPFR
ncbi:MAG TPA: hypothetical protein VNG33_13950 [Polyangiaceae bacterium]|nr:hypothetical protein [Polyangiaceae bacterium]